MFFYVYIISFLFSFSNTSLLICRCLSQAMMNTVAMIQIIPKIPTKVNSLPKRAHPNNAAEIGSKDERIYPCTAPIRRTPSIYALKDTTVPSIMIVNNPTKVMPSQMASDAT